MDGGLKVYIVSQNHLKCLKKNYAKDAKLKKQYISGMVYQVTSNIPKKLLIVFPSFQIIFVKRN